MHKRIFVYLASTVLCALSLFNHSAMAGDDRFSDRDVRGRYSFLFQGTLINSMDGSAAPVAVVGQFEANGDGEVVSVSRTLNVAGDIQIQSAAGSYEVDRSGQGTAQFEVATLDSNGGVLAITRETFSFIIERNKRTIQFVNTSFTGPNGGDLGLRLVVSGAANSR